MIESHDEFLGAVKRFVEQQRELGDDLWPKPDASNQKQPASVQDASKVEEKLVRDEKAVSQQQTKPVTPVEGVIIQKEEPTLFAPEEESLPWEGLTLDEFREKVLECTLCPLSESRKNVVFGEGSPDADLMFIGEAPGRDEDLQGRPFVGRSGQLLTRMIEAMGLTRQDVYIANILKCRPPNNRDPLPSETETCTPYLKHQLTLIKPKIVCLLGRVAASTLLKTNSSLKMMRGRWHDYEGTKVMVTYHPAALLRNPNLKRAAWEDLKKLRFEMDGTEL